MNIEEKRRRIIELIDESRSDGRKIAFYSDPTVQEILDKLYERWEKNNRAGIPLNYAEPEEIEILYNLAIRYSRISDQEAYALYLQREVYGTAKPRDREKKRDKIRRLLRFI